MHLLLRSIGWYFVYPGFFIVEATVRGRRDSPVDALALTLFSALFATAPIALAFARRSLAGRHGGSRVPGMALRLLGVAIAALPAAGTLVFQPPLTRLVLLAVLVATHALADRRIREFVDGPGNRAN